jgi:hypothetical protein
VPIDHLAPEGQTEVAEMVDPPLAAEASSADAPADAETAGIAASGDADAVAEAVVHDADATAVADTEADPLAADGVDPEAEHPVKPERPRSDRQSARRPASPSAGAPRGNRDRRTTAQRLGNFPRADKPASIPAPEHHHLPGWVRRDFARARPPLSNILALLEGDARDQYERRVNELTEGISAGRFSLAWQYPDLVDEGRTLYDKQRRESADTARASRQLDTARRRVQDRIRDAADALTPDVAARLQRQLRTAADSAAINAVASELDGVATAAKSTAEKRREREIERTKTRIMRSAPGARAAAETPQTETWQDVLRRFAEQQAAGSHSE